MGSYNGGSTIIDSRHMGRSEEEWMFTGRSLYGGDGFRDAPEFLRYCDLMGRMRAFADNYEQAKAMPGVREKVETMIVDVMLEVGTIERGKDARLIGVIRQSQGWPNEFIASFTLEPAAAGPKR